MKHVRCPIAQKSKTETKRHDEKKTRQLFCFVFWTAQNSRKYWNMFSTLVKRDKNVLLLTAPCGIIKNEDAEDSLIRFFNY